MFKYDHHEQVLDEIEKGREQGFMIKPEAWLKKRNAWKELPNWELRKKKPKTN
jgi:hypothetical protein